jgi:NADH-quinone oxidoreductase subunit N
MFNQQISDSLSKFLPETVLTIFIIAIVIVELFIKRRTRISGYIALLGLILTFIFTVQQNYITPQTFFYQMVVVDPFALFFKVILLLSAFLIIFFSLLSKEVEGFEYKTQEYYALILSLTLGGFLMASSVNLLMMYLSLELVSISSYILSGYLKRSNRSSEAALKYVIYGGVSSGLMLFGISLIYGITGSTDLFLISMYLSMTPVNYVTLLIAIFLILAGFGYKISAVPFHFWTPDVYEGAPLPVTSLLSVSSKAAGFAMLIRFFLLAFQNLGAVNPVSNGISPATYNILPGFHWTGVIAVIAVATMTLGNIVAIWQDNLKRLLAYSSIAQAGYILLGFVVVNPQGTSAMIIYLAVYLFMNLGAFFAAIMISNKFNTESINEMKGLGYRAPFLCVAMGIFMLSLTGIPLTAGFIGKFYIFSALVNGGYIWLTIIGLLNSVISLYYYVKILKNMFLIRPLEASPVVSFGLGYNVLLIILVVPTILLGVYFAPLTKFAEYSIQMFGIK